MRGPKSFYIFLRIEYSKEGLRLTSRKNNEKGDDLHFSHPLILYYAGPGRFSHNCQRLSVIVFDNIEIEVELDFKAA